MRFDSLSRLTNYLTGVGLLVAVLGLGLDVWIHARNETSLSAEELFALDNPGHVIFGAGLALALSGVLANLWYRPGATRSALRRDRVFGGLLVITSVAVLTFGLSTSTVGHSHATSDVASGQHSPLDGLDLSDEERFLVADSRHEDSEAHGDALQLSADDLVKLSQEADRASRVAQQFQSIDAALAAGYLQVTQDLPLIGAHFINPALADGVFDIDHPEILIYTFQDGAWRLYGLSYLSRMIGFDDKQAPEGFTGSFDHWHWHKDWCFTLKGARAVGPEECKRLRGSFVRRTGYMVHFWTVENPDGLFAHSHPGIVGSSEYIVPFSRVVR
jgi:hypothetical protein